MVRTSVLKALICAGLVTVMPLANAAGLGKLTVNSALGQPLKAEIELVAVEKDELSAITARVASPQAYKEANLDRPGALSNIRFDVAQKPNGEPVLRINSTRTFNEPFVNLLIELSYPSGRLLREYTVLLDPQGTAQAQSFDPVGAPVVKSRGAGRAAPAPRAESGSAPSGAAERTEAPARTADAAASGEAGSYEVKKGDTLARIAANVKPQEVSLEQAMTGIFAGNKSAFVGGNMNRLRSGQILNVPPAAELAAVEPQAARREVKAHAADWNAYRQKLAASVEAKSVGETSSQQSASGKITTSTPDTPSPSAAPKDVLRLSKGELGGTAGGGGGKETAQLRDKVATLQEDAIARERTIKEANERIAALEKNIQEMRKLLELRNQSLAELQKQAAKANSAPTPAPAPAVVPTPTPAPAPAVTAPTPGPTDVTPAPVPAPAVEAPKEEPLVKAIPDSTPTPEPKVEKLAEPAPAAAPAAPSGPSLLDHVRDNAVMLAAIAVGVLVLLLATLKYLSNRRRRSLATFEDSIMTGGDLKANTVFGNTQGGSIDTGDTSFLTDFSQAGMGTIDTNDVDPIAEAEVYMAYGRDAQAEEILKEAMSKDPNRHEIKLKLLEIYAARKNLIAFETLASELYAATGGKSTPTWVKAAEMGRTLDPENPLYGSAQGLPADEPDTVTGFADNESADTTHEPEIADIGPSGEENAEWDLQSDSNDDSNVLNFEKKHEQGQPDDGMDFNLDLPEETPEERHDAPAASGAFTPMETDSIISQAYGRPKPTEETFDLGEPLDQQTISPSGGEDDLSLDFSLPEDKIGSDYVAEPNRSEEALSDGLDFDFNLDEEAAKADATSNQQTVDLSDIDLDMDKNDFEPAAMDDMSFDEDVPAGQEVATKLDLAKAYMEMGDKEGAREILEEVIQEGDTQQKDDAKKLLAAVS